MDFPIRKPNRLPDFDYSTPRRIFHYRLYEKPKMYFINLITAL